MKRSRLSRAEVIPPPGIGTPEQEVGHSLRVHRGILDGDRSCMLCGEERDAVGLRERDHRVEVEKPRLEVEAALRTGRMPGSAHIITNDLAAVSETPIPRLTTWDPPLQLCNTPRTGWHDDK